MAWVDEHPCCTVEDCGRAAHARGLCQMHYFRQWRGKPLGTAEPQKVRHLHCVVPTCGHRPVAGGLCDMHGTRVRRHGDPHTVLTPKPRRGRLNGRWTGSRATYVAVHGRLRSERGSATAHECRCGSRAQHWAYNHSDPAERVCPTGPYSTDLDRYVAMCVSCHKRLDLAARAHDTMDDD